MELVEVVRADRVPIKQVRRNQDGYLETTALAARTGILLYIKDGKPFKELVPAEVLFDEESTKGAIGLPMTDRHPKETVNSKNAGRLMKGFTQGPTTRETKDGEEWLGLGVKLMEEDTLQKVEDGTVELSFGYKAHLDMTPGEYKGERYDAVQKKRIYNHLALVPKARAGTNARLRLDEAFHMDTQEEDMVKITVDGKEIEVSEDAAAVIKAGLEKAAAKPAPTNSDAAVAAEKLRADTAERELAELKKKDEAAKTDEAKKAEAERIDGLVKERQTVLDSAKSVLAKTEHEKLDGLSNLDVMKLVITTLDAEEKLDGASEDFIKGAFKAAVKASKTDSTTAPKSKVGEKLVNGPKGQRQDGADGKVKLTLDEAQEAAKARLRDRYKQPLSSANKA